MRWFVERLSSRALFGPASSRGSSSASYHVKASIRGDDRCEPGGGVGIYHYYLLLPTATYCYLLLPPTTTYYKVL